MFATVSNPLDKFVLEDAGNLESVVANELSYGVMLALEEQIVYGNGLAAGSGFPNLNGPNFTGLLEASTQSQTALASDFLTTRAAITKLEVAGMVPSAFVMLLSDWEASRRQRSTPDSTCSTPRARPTVSPSTRPPVGCGASGSHLDRGQRW